jgi:uncharacterized membrane protein
MMYFWFTFLGTFIAVAVYFVLQKGGFISGLRKEDPMVILKCRFASGEIDEEEYEERKAVLEEDEYLTYNP